MKRFEELEHTADVGIRAHGKTLDALFANAAAGMFSLITDLKTVEPKGEYEVRLTAKDGKSLLFDFLSELLVIHETQKVLFSRFTAKVTPKPPGLAVDARARGERIDKKRHPLHLMVKAVTYHGMVLDAEKGVAEVIFDI